MRLKHVEVFRFSELSETAKDRAKTDHAASLGFCWAGEYMDSINALAAHFDGRMHHWEIDWFNSSYSSASFRMPEMDAKEIKRRLDLLGSYNKRTGKGHGDCKLTGFCADECAIDGFRIAWRQGERDLEKLMQAAFDSWLKAAQADCEDQFSDEQFSENCDANNYEFYANGELA